MKIRGIAIYADEGKYIGRKSARYAEDFGRAFTLLKGETIADFIEVTELPEPRPTDNGKTYDERVEELIRERYTIGQELAIQRQRETKPEEFAEYNAFCENCKLKAKEEVL